MEWVIDLDLGQWQEKKGMALRPRMHTKCRVCKGCNNFNMLEASHYAVMAVADRHGRVRCGLSRGARTEIGDLQIKSKPAWSLPCQWGLWCSAIPARTWDCGVELGACQVFSREYYGALDYCTWICLHNIFKKSQSFLLTIWTIGRVGNFLYILGGLKPLKTSLPGTLQMQYEA